MNEISAIIVIKGHPPHAMETIASVDDFASEILVADIGIDDELLQDIKKNKKVKVITIDQDVPYVELIRNDLKKYAKNEYILFMDPDEILTDDLKKILLENLDSYDYFKIPRKNLILHHWMQHTLWWPDYQVRLFKKNHVIWPTKLHAQPEVKGNGLTIDPEENQALLHHNYESVDEFMTKALRYAKSEAHEYIKDNKNFKLPDAIKRSISEFVGRYFAHEGYKDGIHGFVLAWLQMMYCMLVYFYYWEEKKYVADHTSIPDQARAFFLQGLLETNYWLIQKNLINPVKKLKTKMQNFFLSRFK